MLNNETTYSYKACRLLVAALPASSGHFTQVLNIVTLTCHFLLNLLGTYFFTSCLEFMFKRILQCHNWGVGIVLVTDGNKEILNLEFPKLPHINTKGCFMYVVFSFTQTHTHTFFCKIFFSFLFNFRICSSVFGLFVLLYNFLPLCGPQLHPHWTPPRVAYLLPICPKKQVTDKQVNKLADRRGCLNGIGWTPR